jgi:hypothetical protein
MGKRDEKLQQAPAQQPKISFDAWWAIASKKLATHHHKEIVVADFKARGLSSNETMAAYNKALQQYGV